MGIEIQQIPFGDDSKKSKSNGRRKAGCEADVPVAGLVEKDAIPRIPVSSKNPVRLIELLRGTMILLDPDQPEAANGFPQLASTSATAKPKAALPSNPTLTRYLREAQLAVGLKGEVTVLLTTDAGIRELNRRFRKKNKATDVLSFPAAEPSFGQAGDLAISVETAARQAEEHGHKVTVELRVLLLHGLLHLAGYDHEADEGQMARKENRLRAKLRLPRGLIERANGSAVKERSNSTGLARKASAPVRSATR